MQNTAHPMDRTANWCSHGAWVTVAKRMCFSPFKDFPMHLEGDLWIPC
jgi:hypothetical protein